MLLAQLSVASRMQLAGVKIVLLKGIANWNDDRFFTSEVTHQKLIMPNDEIDKTLFCRKIR